MNLFARVSGGWISDRLNMRTGIGMRGRLWLVTILLILEGAMILVFAFAESLAGAVVTMCILSIFTQAAEGAIYGVIPYLLSKLHTGAVAGRVNVTSVLIRFGESYERLLKTLDVSFLYIFLLTRTCSLFDWWLTIISPARRATSA
jgi:nitrate/nitrite transporter NarK